MTSPDIHNGEQLALYESSEFDVVIPTAAEHVGCEPDICDYLMPSGEDGEYDDAFYERLAAFVSSADKWDDQVVGFRGVLERFRKGEVQDPVYYRNTRVHRAMPQQPQIGKSKGTKDKLLASRQAALTQISSQMGDWDSQLTQAASSTAIDEYIGKIETISYVDQDNLTDTENGLAGEFYGLFLAEQRPRAELAKLCLDFPRAVDLFEAGSFEDLPESVQKIASLDIERRDRSILQRQTRRPIHEDELSIADAIVDYELNARSVELLKVMGTAACAANVTVCGANQFGLCRQLLERIPVENLPTELTADIMAKHRNDMRRRSEWLGEIPRYYPVMKLLQIRASMGVISRSTGPNKHGTGKRSGRVGDLSEADLLHESKNWGAEKREMGSFGSVRVRIGKDEYEITDVSDADHVAGVVESIKGHKLFDDYLKRYGKDELGSFLSNSLEVICLSPNYSGLHGGIVPLTKPNKRRRGGEVRNEAGLVEKIYRLSGAKLSLTGDSGAKVGRDTRIFFSQATGPSVQNQGSRTRYVSIFEVSQKEANKKYGVLEFARRAVQNHS